MTATDPYSDRYATIWMQILAEPATADVEPEAPVPERRAIGSGVLLFLGLLWLALMVWITHSNLASRTDPGEVASAAALTLPSVVTGALLAGACAGLALVDAVSRRREIGWVGALILGLVGGALIGGATGGVIVFAYGTVSAIVVLSATVAVAGVLGGLTAALPRPVLAAGLAATFIVLVIGVLIGSFQAPLKDLLGAGPTPASQFGAARGLSYLAGTVEGLVAAVLAHLSLRRHGPRHWAWFALAGGSAGLFFTISYLITQLGGASLFDRVSNQSEADTIALALNDNARIVQAMLVLFAGAILSMILIGRRLSRGAAS